MPPPLLRRLPPRAIVALGLALATLIAAALAPAPRALAQQSPPGAEPGTTTRSIEELVAAVVQIKAFINPDGRSVATLGREREGTGIVISSDGLVVTIGYVILEAHAVELSLADGRTVRADVVGYDYDTGFGLVRAASPLKVRPMELGKSRDLKTGDPALIASFGGADGLGGARIAAKREFAGYWEYLLEEALFTTPPHPRWAGAGLVGRDGRLVGIGSLIVGDTQGNGSGLPGNMFVPIDLLPPILGELIAQGKPSGKAKPWIGLSTDEVAGRLVVRRVTPGGPAEKAGLAKGDVIVGIGPAGRKPASLAELYRSIWGMGEAGVTVPVEIQRGGEQRRIDLKSINRLELFKLEQTF
jgi:S1-C subfamily serine protease